MKVIVIGGGPAGMMSAITSAEKGCEVILLEKMNMLGKKLLITGKGRCNITSGLNINDFMQNIPGNGRFLYSCFQNYNNIDIINFLEKQGIKVKEERGNRIFPVSDKSQDVLNAFIKRLNQLKVDIRTNSNVTEINVKENRVIGVTCNGNFIQAEKVILATGGMSYPKTGSTGDGYKMAKKLGHSIKEIKPSLVPIMASDDKTEKIECIKKSTIKNSLNLCKELQGLTLKNVKIQIIDCINNKKIYEDFGEMIFTHFGVSGPIILSGSAHVLRYENIDNLFKDGNVKLNIDLKPAMSEEKLDLRIRRDFEQEKNRKFKNILEGLLPKKMIEPVIKLSGINPDKKVNEITKQERKAIVNLLKNFEITLLKFRTIDEAIITSGGIDIKEINPKTMESKIVKGLFFAGEIIDVDAYTGGFNLQIAYSTGYTAGL